ncbi:MAG TPA: DNA replication and repair protein RecF [Cytophagaceae bacterium]|jgi:DNA replication and repair protein RecF|nr:DNA replication and repair protein RecF [Cytophagaceae bacterium]
MYIEKLNVLNFKNYSSEEISLSPEINLVTGLNGSGKTNLLDAIHCLSLGKSAFSTQEQNLILTNQPFLSVLGFFEKEGKSYEVRYDYQKGSKKQVLLDGKVYDRLSDHIGRFPVVMINPDDQKIIREGSEERRKFFDQLFCQIDHAYLTQLMHYMHLLKQRNALLKEWKEGNVKKDFVLLDSYDAPLLRLNGELHEKRKQYTAHFLSYFLLQYKKLTEGKEQMNIVYQSDLFKNDFPSLFHKNRERDQILERTTLGVHKDDFSFTLGEQTVKHFGSQGQQKSFVIALKLAQLEMMREFSKTEPILLLDDIFDKLDDERIHHLVHNIAGTTSGQIFITDARPERSMEIIRLLKREIRIFHVNKGTVIPAQVV